MLLAVASPVLSRLVGQALDVFLYCLIFLPLPPPPSSLSSLFILSATRSFPEFLHFCPLVCFKKQNQRQMKWTNGINCLCVLVFACGDGVQSRRDSFLFKKAPLERQLVHLYFCIRVTWSLLKSCLASPSVDSIKEDKHHRAFTFLPVLLFQGYLRRWRRPWVYGHTRFVLLAAP